MLRSAGPIPPTIGGLTSLASLKLWGNQLSGESNCGDFRCVQYPSCGVCHTLTRIPFDILPYPPVCVSVCHPASCFSSQWDCSYITAVRRWKYAVVSDFWNYWNSYFAWERVKADVVRSSSIRALCDWLGAGGCGRVSRLTNMGIPIPLLVARSGTPSPVTGGCLFLPFSWVGWNPNLAAKFPDPRGLAL